MSYFKKRYYRTGNGSEKGIQNDQGVEVTSLRKGYAPYRSFFPQEKDKEGYNGTV